MTPLATPIQKSSTVLNKRVARTRTRRRQWVELTAALILTLWFAQRGTAEAATIPVNTPNQGITDPQHCSLQEAIYAAEFKRNKAISQTDPDVTYDTGCTAGTGDDIIVLSPGNSLCVSRFLGWRRIQYLWADGHARYFLKNHYRG